MTVTGHNAAVEERKERKRLQNRLNQRAHRQRIRDEADANPKPRKAHKTPYRIESWRLVQRPYHSTQTSRPAVPDSEHATNDQQVLEHGHSQPPQSHAAEIYRIPSEALSSLELDLTHDSEPSLSADHALIHLIIHNLIRGFMQNMSLLRLMTSFSKAAHDPPLHSDLAAGCEVATVRPTCQTMPQCLFPTNLQMNCPHPTWMVVFPFPEIRNNLIRRQHNFNHKHFLKSLFGDLVYVMSLAEQYQVRPVSISSLPRHRQQDGSLPGNDREGFILWGEPYLKENWEATPIFLTKWSWVVEGCHELVDITNRWRMTRGEDPL
ncbi:hypothetical protein BKA64DRAFT_698411 [Cadophora sp. MPI-SDFR-AT-0126]|nr:hypothetical protein BKA64DRAFT_698411 [Leotiomycetes sp. MPI-SDFR-AT-0126]